MVKRRIKGGRKGQTELRRENHKMGLLLFGEVEGKICSKHTNSDADLQASYYALVIADLLLAFCYCSNSRCVINHGSPHLCHRYGSEMGRIVKG